MSRLPLLLLPGTLNDAGLWRAQIEALADVADIHVADLTTQRSITAMADDAIAAMPAGRFALAGFSLGGFVAFEIARRATDRVLGLALVNTQARPEPAEGRSGRQKMMDQAGRDFPGLTQALVRYMLAPERLHDAALTCAIRTMMERVGADAFVRQSHAVIDRTDSRATLAAVRCPTLVIGGLQDKVAPPRLAEEMAAAIPGARLLLLPDTGHLAPMERPTEVTASMRSWLDQVRAHRARPIPEATDPPKGDTP